MYATVRRYEGIRNPDELAKRVRKGFVPLISEHRGFVPYYWVDDSEEGVMFSTRSQTTLRSSFEHGSAGR